MRQVLTDQKVNMTIRAKLMCAIPSFIWNASLLETCWMKLLRQMVIGGWSRLPTPEDAEDTEFRLRCTKTDILHITNKQSQKCDLEPIFKMLVMFDVWRCPNTTLTNKMLFAKSRPPYKRDPWINIAKLLNVPIKLAARSKQDKSGFAALVDRVVASATPL